MTPKNVAFVGAICVILGWLLASTLTPPVARVQTLRQEPASAPTRSADEPPPVEQLQFRLNELRAAPENRRNPFAFAARDRHAVPPSAVATVEEPPPQLAVAPSGPSYVLSGIGISDALRTAVLTTGSDVHIVKVDDVLGDFTVVEITDASVTLVRGTSRHTLRLGQ